MHQQILRTIDANLNRVSEGLRVLEDVSRFIVEDAKLTRQLKSIRHLLNQSASGIGQKLLENRDAVSDIGAGTDLTYHHKNISSIVRANAKRIQEGLRVLEEMSKLPEVKDSLSTEKLKEFRYLAYSMEKSLMHTLSNYNTTGGRAVHEKTRKKL